MRYPLLLAPVASALLAITSLSPSPAQAQERIKDHRVLIWRGDPDQIVRLEAALGKRGFLGVELLDLTPELRRHFGVPPDRGVMISRVIASSPAEVSRLEPGDILTALDDTPLAASVQLAHAVAAAEEGTEVELEQWRDGRRSVVAVRLEHRERSQFDIAPLITRRIALDRHNPDSFVLHQASDEEFEVDIDSEWLESMVGNLKGRFLETSFLEQLAAMALERSALQDQLERMEQRLVELESQLGALAAAEE